MARAVRKKPATADGPPLVVAITGASGAIYGVRLLEALASIGRETHLVVSDAAALTLLQELKLKRRDVEALATHVHAPRDVGAAIASGSLLTLGMVVSPCSMNTLASIANGHSGNLVSRAAEVTLKERRRLVLVTRETPLHLAHLRNMVSVTKMGGIIAPPVPGFYQHPESIEEMVAHTVGRLLDLFGIAQHLTPPWTGLGRS